MMSLNIMYPFIFCVLIFAFFVSANPMRSRNEELAHEFEALTQYLAPSQDTSSLYLFMDADLDKRDDFKRIKYLDDDLHENKRTVERIGGGTLIGKRAYDTIQPLNSKRSMDSIGGGSLIGKRAFDSIGGGSLIGKRGFDTIGGGSLIGKRGFDSIGGGSLIGKRGLDKIGGGSLIGKRAFDSIGGGSLIGKRAFDSIGGGSLIGKRGFDSIGGGSLIGKRGLDKIGGGSLIGKRGFDSIGGGSLIGKRSMDDSNESSVFKRDFDGTDSLPDKRNYDNDLNNRRAYLVRSLLESKKDHVPKYTFDDIGERNLDDKINFLDRALDPKYYLVENLGKTANGDRSNYLIESLNQDQVRIAKDFDRKVNGVFGGIPLDGMLR